MKSKTRRDSEEAERIFAEIINNRELYNHRDQMLMVGTAGNPLTHKGKPGLDHPERFRLFDLTTVDFDEKWNPDVVCDISSIDDITKKFPYQFDLIHMTQVIEHIPNIFAVPACLHLLLKEGGYAIVDSPWGPAGPDYHGELPSFGDFWRISKDGMEYLFCNLFKIVAMHATDANTSVLLRKLK